MSMLRRLAAVLLLTGILFLTLLAVRRWAGFDYYDPYWIDYDKPGIDITSEGP